MENFCAPNERIELFSKNINDIVTVIAEKYMKDNPICDYDMRAFPEGAFKSNKIGSTIIDMEEKYPDAKQGDYAYAACEITRGIAGAGGIFIIPYGGVTAYLNGKEIYRSSPREEGHVGKRVPVGAPWKLGKNLLVLKIKKLTDGYFRADVSSNSPKWAPIIFDFPSELKKGMLGFAYSELISSDKVVPFDFKALRWYPEPSELPNRRYVAWSCFLCDKTEEITIKGSAKDGIELLIDDNKYSFCGDFKKKLAVKEGKHDLLILGGDYSFNIRKKLTAPGGIVAAPDNFIYVPFVGGSLKSYRTFDKVFKGNYWKTKDNADIRPCLKAQLFGKWSYPLGVTLTGLYKAGKALGSEDIIGYVKTHVLSCIRKYDYSVWDMKTYGYPNLNQQLLWFQELDDIGSFGALMLEIFDEYTDEDKKTAKKIAGRIAEHIMKKQHRRDDGALFRIAPDGTESMWADDLYMCIPFLLNYYKITGDSVYLDETAKQMLLYKKYLFMEKEGILSHTYIFNMNSPSNMPWGRGNGWAIYSLAKILEVMPKNHKDYKALKEYFAVLSEGYIRNQSESGLFHQLINYPDTYEETSSTSMLLYAFSSVYGSGILNDIKLLEASDKAKEGIINKSVDKEGNVYGVCRGSLWSFDADYYRDLLWNTNDTHGIGIVMLGLLKYNEIGDITEGK